MTEKKFEIQKNEIKVKRIEANGSTTEYVPYALFAVDGIQYLLMRVENEKISMENVMLLQARQTKTGVEFEPAEITPNVSTVLYHGLGLPLGILN